MKKILVMMFVLSGGIAFAGKIRQETIPADAKVVPAENSTCVLTSFGGEKLEVVLGKRSESASGVVSYYGKTPEAFCNNVTLVESVNGFVARVTDSKSGHVVTYNYNGTDWKLVEVEPGHKGKCGTAPKHFESKTQTGVRAALKVTGDPVKDGAVIMAAGERCTNIIDILICVDASAKKWILEESQFEGMANAVDLFAADCITRCNAIYANTGLDKYFSFRLVGVHEVAYDCSTFRDGGHVDPEAILENVADAETPNKAVWKNECALLRQVRDERKADIASLLVASGEESPTGTVGIGYSLDDDAIRDASFADIAYNVCIIEAVAYDATMAHEIGHNMGAGHAEMAEKDNSGPQLYGYSTGYYFNVTNAGGNVYMHGATVMAYGDSGYAANNIMAWGEPPEDVDNYTLWVNGYYTETEFFSSAVHTYKHNGIDTGIPLGDETHDNTKLLSKVYPVVANYRVSDPSPVTVDMDGKVYEFAVGESVSIPLGLRGISGAKVSVKGLPAGLKYYADGMVVEGIPTKSGVYSVDFTISKGSEIYKANTRIVVRGANEYVIDYRTDSNKGGVTGAGSYVLNKKVTLKANAVKGYVFAGWYEDEAFTLPIDFDDWRNPSLVITVTADRMLYPCFISPELDLIGNLIVDETEIVSNATSVVHANTNGLMSVYVESPSQPKLAFTGLPSGIKYDAKKYALVGVSKKPGYYSVVAKIMNTSVKKAVEKRFTLVVDNFTAANGLLTAPLRNGPDQHYAVDVGVSKYELPELASMSSASVKVSGLPSGLKYNAATHKIEGTATKAGNYTVYVTVDGVTSTFVIVAKALPDFVVGNFSGAGFFDDGVSEYASSVENNFLANLTISSVGKITGTIKRLTPEGSVLTSRVTGSLESVDDEDCFYADFDWIMGQGVDRTLVSLRMRLGSCDPTEMGERCGIAAIYERDGVVSDAFVQIYQTITSKAKTSDLRPKFAVSNVTLKRPIASSYPEGEAELSVTINPSGKASLKIVEKYVEKGRNVVKNYTATTDFCCLGFDEDDQCFYGCASVQVGGRILAETVQLYVDENMKVTSGDFW